MPEPYWPKHRKKHSYTLKDAEQNSRYARLRCHYCKRELWFLLTDLIRIFGGKTECDDVVFKHRWRCTKCGCEVNDLHLEHDRAAPAKVRRLVEVRYVMRVMWRDEEPWERQR